MGKIIEVRNLYKDRINDIANNVDTWTAFLNSASWNFKYSFNDQVLIYAQRPDATACAEMEVWNKKIKRWINKDSEVIFVTAKENSNYPFRIVFDVSDTHNYRNTPYKLWEVKPEYENEIIEALEGNFGDITPKESLAQAITFSAYNMVTDNMQDYLLSIQRHKFGTELEKLSDDEIESIFMPTLWASVSYMIMKRCGIDPNIEINKSEFSFISKFNNENLITILGTATSDIAELGLREIAKTVINLQNEERNQNRTFVKNEVVQYSNNEKNIEGGNNNVEYKLRETRRLYDTKYNSRKGEDSDRQIRYNEIELSKGTSESRIYDIVDEQTISTTSDIYSRNSDTDDKSNIGANGEERWSDRAVEDDRPDEMGGLDEQLQNDSRGTSDSRTDLQLDLPSVNEQKEIIAEVENTSVFSFTQEMIDSVLTEGSHFENGKFRIYEQLTKSLSSKENADFLKNEYGIGGRSSDRNGVHEDHDSKGIKLSNGYSDDSAKMLLTWLDVEKRLRELISSDRYFNSKEKEKYQIWKDEKETIKDEKTSIDITTSENVSEEYEYLVGDNVFIGINEYEIVNINENEVSLADIKFPLLIEQFTFEEFNKKAKENPYNTHLKKKNRDVSDNVEENKNIEERLYEFANQYDIYDVDEVTIEQIKDDLKDNDSIRATLEYLKQIYEAEDEELNDEFENKLLGFIVELESLIKDNIPEVKEDIIEAEKVDTIKTEKAEKEINISTSNIKRKRRNKIEYFDLHPEIPLSERNNFKIKDYSKNIEEKTKKEKFEGNINAIKILKQCEIENRYATPEEQEILAQYVGWGGLSEAFDSNNSSWANEFLELKDALTEKEYREARESTLTAFYTPPIVIESIYNALRNMGLEEGNILEPSCGVGNFMGMLPEELEKCKMYGIELDGISGRIARQLYQKSTIAVKGFEEVELPDSFFDVAVGNVPFGDYKLTDKRYDKNKFLIHDYFFAKALDKVRPNGVVAFITSKGTLDKENENVRKYISQRAELIGAIRLPNNTFKKNAGTVVTSDIIFLKKKDRLTDIEEDWVHLDTNEDGIRMNSYFVKHPEMILGKMEMTTTAFGLDSTCNPFNNISLDESLKNAIQYLNAEIEDYQLDEMDEEETSIPADSSIRNFSYTIVDNKVYYRENSRMYLQDVPLTTISRIKGMIAIRDSVRNLIELQTDDASEDEIKEEQKRLNNLYDNFTKTYGLINSRANSQAFAEDNSYYLLCSLEVLNENKQFIKKADMFYKRTIKPHKVVSMADNAVDALILSISEKASVDLEYMSNLTGKTQDELVKELEGSIYKDPILKKFVTADEYLSGNVRQKLEIAQGFAKIDSEYEKNVKALESVKIKDLSASEISVKLGTTWIPPKDIEDFIFELLETDKYSQRNISVTYSNYTSDWNIRGKSVDKRNVKAYNTYGTSRINAYKIIEQTLNLKDVKIFDTVINIDGEEEKVLNVKETTMAQAKQELIKSKFEEWIWRDQERRERLVKFYNVTFNCLKPREYDGQYITFGGINPEISLRSHQVNAIAHILYGGNTLLAHEVGAGKTFEMVAAAMESKRLGLCNKSLFVIPNHIIEQFANEFMQLYPSANILVATKKDFATNNRKKFCSKISTGEYDAIILGHSQFEKIQMSKERQERILEKQISDIMLGIQDLKDNDGERYSIKQLEQSKKKIEEKLKKLNDQSRKDNVITFEQLGVDRLFVDEAHYFKNLFIYSKMRDVGGIAQTEAKKSSDLFMKCRYLDELTGGKGIIFATGTPISNSMVEMYTMQRYLQYNTLEKNNLTQFDAWASTFGETITTMQLSPEGTGYRSKTSFAKFFNLPELMSMFKEVADIQTSDTLNLPVPKANFETIVVKPSPLQKEMVADLGERAEKIRRREVNAKQDNMLNITNEGRKLALDQRIINEMLPDFEGSKVNICANNLYKIWDETSDRKLTQLVFCDLSTPNNDGKFNVYDDLKNKLINKGIPQEEIAFIHDANTETKKQELFTKVRKGNVRILIGSTAKMGAGTNVQNKIIALHHLDCPWRPADLTQRNGRGIRQGNENPEINVYTYVTEGTFDAYLYQLVENKQKFISQIMTSKAIVRSAEDVDEKALSYAEIKALAAGNPLIIEKTELDTEVSKLKLLKQSYLSQIYRLEDLIVKHYPVEIKRLQERIVNIEKDIEIVTENTKIENEEKFSPMTLKEKIYSLKESAGNELLEICKSKQEKDSEEIGKYRGLKMFLEIDTFSSLFKLKLKNNAVYEVELGADKFGNITRIDNVIANMQKELETAKIDLENIEKQFNNAKIEVKKPFDKEEELKEKTIKLDRLNVLLNLNEKVKEIIVDDDEIEKDDKKSQDYNKDPIR